MTAPTPRVAAVRDRSEDHSYHDSSDCPYGATITRYDDDSPSVAYPRRCNWCTEHDRPTSS